MNVYVVPIESEGNAMSWIYLVYQIICILLSSSREDCDLEQLGHSEDELFSIRSDMQLHGFGVEVYESFI